MLQPYLIAAGDRFYRTGAERGVGTGTLALAGRDPVAVILYWQFPGKLRIEQGGDVIVVDTQKEHARKFGSGDYLGPGDVNEVETLLEDSFDGFLVAHVTGATRFVGKAFRSLSAPERLCDIVRVFSKSKIRGNTKSTMKEYRFDSRTRLLANVSYRRAGGPAVEVHLSDWLSVQNQRVARTVTRVENGRRSFTLTLSTVNFQSDVDDSKFERP